MRYLVILLDLVMPVMDGYTFLSIMKSTPDYRDHTGDRHHAE